MWLTIRTELRGLRRRWRFHLLLLLVLGSGLGVSTALAAIADHIAWRPLRVPTADRLVTFEARVGDGWIPLLVSPTQVRRLQAEIASPVVRFAGVRPATGEKRSLFIEEAAFELSTTTITTGFFDLFGLDNPALTVAQGPTDVVVVGHRFWTSHSKSDGLQIGSLASLNDFDPTTFGLRKREVRIGGIAPPGFYLPGDAELWIPVSPLEMHFEHFQLWALLLQTSELNAQNSGGSSPYWIEHASRVLGHDLRIRPLRDALVPQDSGVVVLMLLATAGLLLTVWCQSAVFLATESLSAARALTTRLALGASRRRLLTEQMIGPTLTIAASLPVGISIAILIQSKVMAELPLMAGRYSEVGSGAIVFAIGICFTFVATQAAIVYRVISAHVSTISAGTERAGPQSGIVLGLTALSVAASVAFLYVSTVLAASYYRTLHHDYGFDTRNLIAIHTSAMMAGIREPSQRRAGIEAIEAFVRQEPGVVAASRVHGLPFGTYNVSETIEAPEDGGRRVAVAKVKRAGPGFVATLGIPLIVGRAFTENDVRQGTTAIVTRNVAEELWPQGGAVGSRLVVDELEFQVIGVVAEFTDRASPGSAPTANLQVFLPGSDLPDVIARTHGNPLKLLEGALAVGGGHSRYMRVSGFSYDVRRRRLAGHDEAYALFTAVIALCSVLVAGLGAVIAVEQASQRSIKSTAIRLAVGASHCRALQAALKVSLVFLMGGGVAGLGLGLGLASTLGHWSRNVRSVEPIALIACMGVVILGISATLLIPSRVMNRLDVSALLRDER